jgi:hypothetical protein
LRSRPARSRRRTESAADPISADAASKVSWDDLSEPERTALKRMNRGPYPALAEAVGLRLIELGLAVTRSGEIGISRQGRELVITTLLEARQDGADS